MFSFNIVKKIGEGKYLGDDAFIIERIRKTRALRFQRQDTAGHKHRLKGSIRNEKFASA